MLLAGEGLQLYRGAIQTYITIVRSMTRNKFLIKAFDDTWEMFVCVITLSAVAARGYKLLLLLCVNICDRKLPWWV